MHENPIFVIALLISLLIPLFWLLLWKLPQWQVAAVPEIKDRIDLESKSRQTLAQILGGAALLVGLYFTSQTLRTTQEGQITDRFTKAIAQLGDKNVAVRLGGIYALERIAKDSEDDHWAVMEILTAFVREQTRERKTVTVLKESPETVEISLQKMGEFPSDIQAALTALGRRTRTHNNGERQLLKLYYANLEGAYLWQANLQGAILKGTNLQSANLIQANLQEANLEGVNLQGAILLRANLQDARLTQANLQYAFLGSDDPRGEIVSATLQRGYLWQANLQGASLGGVNFEEAKLMEANLQGANLQRANLQRANLQRANLQRANLGGADLTNVIAFTQDQVNTACVDENTQLPEGLVRPAPCPAKP
jgi:uncharacterized protein YjbI with pentapeptide repeats